MIQIILHAFGDYMTQNSWMANNKTKFTFFGWFACLIHCTLYSLPFLFIASPKAVLFIWLTHFLMDKFRLAKYWLKFVNFEWQSPTGFTKSTPDYLAVWILIIVDNTIHLACNYFAIAFLGN